MTTMMTVWWCSLCREVVQCGARPDNCPDCGPTHGDVRPLEVPYIAPPSQAQALDMDAAAKMLRANGYRVEVLR